MRAVQCACVYTNKSNSFSSFCVLFQRAVMHGRGGCAAVFCSTVVLAVNYIFIEIFIVEFTSIEELRVTRYMDIVLVTALGLKRNINTQDIS